MDVGWYHGWKLLLHKYWLIFFIEMSDLKSCLQLLWELYVQIRWAQLKFSSKVISIHSQLKYIVYEIINYKIRVLHKNKLPVIIRRNPFLNRITMVTYKTKGWMWHTLLMISAFKIMCKVFEECKFILVDWRQST